MARLARGPSQKNVPREIAAQIFMGGANLYGLGKMDLKKADAVAAKS